MISGHYVQTSIEEFRRVRFWIAWQSTVEVDCGSKAVRLVARPFRAGSTGEHEAGIADATRNVYGGKAFARGRKREEKFAPALAGWTRMISEDRTIE